MNIISFHLENFAETDVEYWWIYLERSSSPLSYKEDLLLISISYQFMKPLEDCTPFYWGMGYIPLCLLSLVAHHSYLNRLTNSPKTSG